MSEISPVSKQLHIPIGGPEPAMPDDWEADPAGMRTWMVYWAGRVQDFVDRNAHTEAMLALGRFARTVRLGFRSMPFRRAAMRIQSSDPEIGSPVAALSSAARIAWSFYIYSNWDDLESRGLLADVLAAQNSFG